MRILVLGSTGFLGSWVVNKLKENYDNKLIFKSSLSLGCDLRNYHEVDSLFEKFRPEIVINCAAHVGGIQYGLKHTMELFHDNISMIVNIFKACNDYKITRLIQPISNCAYPSHLSIYKEDAFWSGPVDDSVFTYAETRRMMVVAAKSYFLQSGMDTISIVHPNLYGPGDHFEEFRSHALGALVSKVVLAKKENKSEVAIWGTGSPIREWLHVEDAAKSIVNAIDVPPYEDIINVGSGSGISIKDLAVMIKKISGWNGNFVFDRSKIDGAPIKIIDGTKGEKFLHMHDLKLFEDGIKETIEFYISTNE
jgi:GDP-L-fucose synthase